jgi:hypothetical protein
MELKELNGKLVEYVRANKLDALAEADKEQVMYSLNFITEQAGLFSASFQKYNEGNKQYIFGCMNIYEWSRQSSDVALGKLKGSWDQTLEKAEKDFLKLFTRARKILVDLHNKDIPDEYADDRIEQYEP